MGKKKVYVILYDKDYVYIPIKAKYNPYANGGKTLAYCACMPCFFGGNVEKNDKSASDTLKREVKEESQGKFVLTNTGDPEQLLNDSDYTFYRSNLFSTSNSNNWTERNIKIGQKDYSCFFIELSANTTSFKPNQRENQAIIKIRIDNIISENDEDKMASRMLEICKILKFCTNKKGENDFDSSHTKTAFKYFFRHLNEQNNERAGKKRKRETEEEATKKRK